MFCDSKYDNCCPDHRGMRFTLLAIAGIAWCLTVLRWSISRKRSPWARRAKRPSSREGCRPAGRKKVSMAAGTRVCPPRRLEQVPIGNRQMLPAADGGGHKDWSESCKSDGGGTTKEDAHICSSGSGRGSTPVHSSRGICGPDLRNRKTKIIATFFVLLVATSVMAIIRNLPQF
jgi:hypothetical protein